MIYLEGLLTPRYQAVNRSQKRLMEKEFKAIVDRIWEVEEIFYKMLFSKVDYDYNHIYVYYLTLFQEHIDWIEKVMKPDYWIVNKHYFEQNFKPISS